MKRILITTGIFPPDIGGPATYGAIMEQALKKRGFEVKVLIYSRTGKILPKGLRHFWYFLKLMPAVKKADAVLALNAVSAGRPALFWAKMFKKKFVVRIVGDYAWEMAVAKSKTSLLIDDFQKISKRGFLHSVQVKTCKQADTIIVPSKYLASIVKGWGVPSEKIKVIYNGVDFKPSDLNREEARSKVGVHGNIILSVGRLVPWKGFRMLIKIMPRILELKQFARLVIVGDGPDKKILESMVKNMGLINKVFLVGKKSKEELAIYLSASDMFVLNSGYEGFSHLILEAMAAGVPIIASAVGGNKEVVKQGDNGFLVKYNDEFNIIEAIKALWNDKELAANFAEKGKETVQRFSSEKMIEETIKVL